MKMANVGFVFTTVFVVSYGFVKTVLLAPTGALYVMMPYDR